MSKLVVSKDPVVQTDWHGELVVTDIAVVKEKRKPEIIKSDTTGMCTTGAMVESMAGTDDRNECLVCGLSCWPVSKCRRVKASLLITAKENGYRKGRTQPSTGRKEGLSTVIKTVIP
jgi:hypothetical protein